MTPSWRRVLLAVVLAAILFVVWRAARLGWLAWSTAQAANQLAGALQVDAPVAELPELTALAQRLSALDDELQPLAPVLRSLAGLPNIGPALAAAPQRVDAAAQLAPHLGWLLGMDAPRTYLLLLQNNQELRATGGYISAFGRLVVDRGRITGLNFVDSYEVFSLQSEYPPAPQPMQDYMGIELQVARDANWSPDLPAAAAALLPLYTQDTGVEADGVLTLDLYAVEHFVAAMPGLRIEGSAESLTRDNLLSTLIHLWDQPLATGEGVDAAAANRAGDADRQWWLQRKDFIVQVAGAMLQRMPGLSENPADPAALLAAAWGAFEDRALQLWVEQAEAQAKLAHLGWDGGLRPREQGDYLAVVDSNLGYNKVNAAVERSLDYGVDWSGGVGEATLTITYTHPVTAEVALCDPAPRYGDSYADLIERCYFDYIRVYAPPGSQLRDIRGVRPDSGTSKPAEKGLQQFAAFLILPPNQTRTVTFVYTLPPEITRADYSLRIQRQSGTAPLPITVNAGGATAAQVIAGNTWDWAAE